jgi:hypothetical protein
VEPGEAELSLIRNDLAEAGMDFGA